MAKTRKTKTVFICSECGEAHPRWNGQCSSCGAWNSLEEQTASNDKAAAPIKIIDESSLVIAGSKQQTTERMQLKIKELDQLLGGGLVKGSVTLIGGEPGVGKSTLLLAIARCGYETVYISGEESTEQIAQRATRVGAAVKNLKLAHETSAEAIIGLLEKLKPELVFIDSIQTMHNGKGFAGTVSQIRDSANMLLEFAKQNNIAVLMTGHITKDGQLAGPRQLEHAVDVVLYFESQKNDKFRLLRSVKNRFGSTGEIAIFEMTPKGLIEATSRDSMLQLNETGGIGSVLFPQVEGSRVIPLEIQVLVTPTGLANGRRIGEGVDASRIHITAAILEKYLEYRLSQCDIFVKVNGGPGLRDSGGDLALLAAMASSYLEVEVNSRYAVAGEVSLTGQIRNPARIAEREKALQGLKVPHYLFGGLDRQKPGISKAVYCDNLPELIKVLFEKN